VNPRKDAKFSPNLFNFLTYHRGKSFIHVYQDKKTNRYYIGVVDDGWFHGSQLMTVFCNGAQAEAFAYMPKDCEEFTDVTEWFWNKYFEVGKAIYNLPEWHQPNYELATA
jgi:hypothetical protein